jgi:4-amino-4-deoxy-L-arabinose transferase-like glycosyltransferase
VTQTSNELFESPPLSPAARLLWLVLIVATLYLCYFHNLGALGLVGPDEPRYAWIARDMQETGDYITPRLYGKPWFEKPPLYYWGAALSFKFFGVSEASARFPSAISAFLATLALAWLALRLYSAETARWLLLLLPTTVGMIGFSHAAATDMPFAAMLTIAMVFAAKLLNLVRSASAPLQPFTSSASRFRSFTPFTSSTSLTPFLFGFFLGLAVLAKGPAAIILSGGAVLLWAILTKRWRDAFRCLHPVAIASFCLTALPWYIFCARRNPGFFHVFIIEHNFNRFLTPQFQHVQPFWFYPPILLIAVFPWTILLLTGIYSSCRNSLREQITPGDLFSICWGIIPLLFFSISKSKLPGYILPAVPVIGILLARAASAVNAIVRRSTTVSFLLNAFGSGVAAFTLFAVPNSLPLRLQDLRHLFVFILSGLALSFSFVALSFLTQRSSFAGDLTRALGFGVFLFILSIASDKKTFDRSGIWVYSARDLSHALLTSGGTPENLRLVGMNRSTSYQLNFYFHSDLKEWNGMAGPGELLVGRAISCSKLNLTTGCNDLWASLDKADDWELLQISSVPSPSGLGGGNAGSKLGNLQPR